MAIFPVWLSTEHHWRALTPFWLSADETTITKMLRLHFTASPCILQSTPPPPKLGLPVPPIMPLVLVYITVFHFSSYSHTSRKISFPTKMWMPGNYTIFFFFFFTTQNLRLGYIWIINVWLSQILIQLTYTILYLFCKAILKATTDNHTVLKP